ncbi:hypothetical protein HPB50_028763 [Hyalomma asiaticum]|nr:hypothetical protein HPB50_028763 [Hyalomma asiaticum]
MLCALSSCVHDFFRRKENDGREDNYRVLGRMELASLRRCTVRRQLVEIGFRHEKRNRNSLLIGRVGITDWRNRYLRDVERYRTEGPKIFYLTRHGDGGTHTSIVWTDTVVQKRGRLFARANGLITGPKQRSGKGSVETLANYGDITQNH